MQRFPSSLHLYWKYLSRLIYVRDLYYQCERDIIQIAATAKPAIATILADQRMDILFKHLGRDTTMLQLREEEKQEKLGKYHQFLRDNFNIDAEQAKQMMDEAMLEHEKMQHGSGRRVKSKWLAVAR